MTISTRITVVAIACVLAVGCTAGDESGSTTTTAAPASAAAATGPAPGVTDDAIQVGVTYVDLASIGDIATLDHGDYEAAYQALFDDINANGGINGRTVEATIVGINPVGTDSAEAACVQLTEDEDVFVAMGFFNGDAPNCVVSTHQTALMGGSMTPQRLAQAQAPWFSADAGSDLQTEVVRAMAEAGEFDGSTLGLYGSEIDEAQVNDEILPLLDELGVEVTETVLTDVTATADITQSNAAVQTAAERFTASGVDTVLLVGDAGLGWANGVEPTDYRPRLLLTSPNSVQAWARDPAGHDLSVLEDAAAGNVYGPNQKVWELPAMQACTQIVEDAGEPVPEPDSVPEDEGAVYLAGMDACRNVRLFQARVGAAGEAHNNGTLAAAADGLEVELPDQPEPLTYGPPPHADGDLPAYVYDWDPDAVDWALRD